MLSAPGRLLVRRVTKAELCELFFSHSLLPAVVFPGSKGAGRDCVGHKPRGNAHAEQSLCVGLVSSAFLDPPYLAGSLQPADSAAPAVVWS